MKSEEKEAVSLGFLQAEAGYIVIALLLFN